MGHEPVPMLIGRADASERLAAVLTELRAGNSTAIVVSGEAGMGKTSLLRDVARHAGDLTTVTASGYEAESRLGFSLLQRLLVPFWSHVTALPAPQVQALETAFGLSEGPPPGRFIVALAATSLLTAAVTDRAVLCIVDDVQWADKESVDTLAFLARRLDSQGLGLILGVCSSRPDMREFAGIPSLHLGPLTESDMKLLLSTAVLAPPTPGVATRLVTESEGNPLALLEYSASLTNEQLTGAVGLPPALPVGERLAAGFQAQIARLPRPTRTMLLIMAAAGASNPVAVSDAFARLNIDADDALPAVHNSLLLAQPELAFRHPLIRSVAYDSAGKTGQSEVHTVLAEVADGQGMAAVAAWHRACAATAPDEGVAAQLELAAAEVRQRSGYAEEAIFLTEAVRQSRPGTEEYARRLLSAGRAHLSAGNGAQAERLLQDYGPNGFHASRIEAVRVEATLEAHSHRSGLEAATLLGTADRLPAEESDAARHLLQTALYIGFESRQFLRETTLVQIATRLLEHPSASADQKTAADWLCEGLAIRCIRGYRAAAPVLREALGRGNTDLSLTRPGAMCILAWRAMEDLWDDDFASTTWPQLTSTNESVGAWGSAWLGIGASALSAARHGEFGAAQRLFDEATSVAIAVGLTHENLWAVLIEFRAWQGREAETRAMAKSVIDEWAARGYSSTTSVALHGLTVLDLSLGRYAAALESAKRVADEDPPGNGSRVLPDLIEAAVRTGSTDIAEDSLKTLTDRATASGTPWAKSVLARSQAMVLGTSPEAEGHYQESLRLLNHTSLKTEIARTQLLFGEWLRRQRRRSDAHEQLTASLEAFAAMGAVSFAQRAAGELAVAGVGPVAISTLSNLELTGQEKRVAGLAAEGMTNTEISEQLFISGSTVDYHLSKIFHKLQITSRRRIKEKL